MATPDQVGVMDLHNQILNELETLDENDNVEELPDHSPGIDASNDCYIR